MEIFSKNVVLFLPFPLFTSISVLMVIRLLVENL